LYPKDDQFSLLLQNVFSRKAAANEKNPPRKSLRRNACAKCVFLGSGCQGKETTQQISSKKSAQSSVETGETTSFLTHISPPFSSLLLFAAV
jgi:hypothetical protein